MLASQKNTKRNTKAKAVKSNLLMEECEICRRDFFSSYGHLFILILAPESYKYSALFYLLLLRLFGTLMCMGLKLQMLCCQSPNSLLCFD